MNNTVVGNSNGIVLSAFDAVVANNIVAGSDSLGYAISPTGGSTVVDRNNLAWDNPDDFFVFTPHPTTIFADPLFANTVDFRPSPFGPAVDAGDDALLDASFATDLDGNPRRIGTVDIGAYEVPEPARALGAGAAGFALALLARARRTAG